MPIITALEANQRDNERVKLYLDDKFAMNLPHLKASQLAIGQLLSQHEVAALADCEVEQRAFDRALRYLSYRPRSTEEVRRNLARHKVADFAGRAGIGAIAAARLFGRPRLRRVLAG